MALPVIADTFRVAISYNLPARSLNAVNVVHFLAPGKDEDDVFDALNTNVADEMWYPTTDQAEIVQVVITALDGTPDGRVYGPSSLTGDWRDGGGTQDYNPQVAAIVKLATAATGRSGRGRIFLPWVSDGNSIGGAIDATAVTNTTSAWVDFANAMATGGVALAVASYKNETASQVLNLACEAISGTQRRRNRR